MSTLTKILIVLLTIASIFLCGIVVTYVATASNYKEQYTMQKRQLDAAQRERDNAVEQQAQAEQAATERENELNTQIASLQATVDELKNQLVEADREVSRLRAQDDTWKALVKDFSDKTGMQVTTLNNTLDRLQKLESTKIELEKQNAELTRTVSELMAERSTLAQNNNRLSEEKKQLRQKLDMVIRQYGKTIPETPTGDAPSANVAPLPDPAPQPTTSDIGLKGKITAVDLKNSLAEISIGSANGVKPDMKLHVTRGSEFICDLVILDVDADKAVGIIELVSKQPQKGDTVSTNL